MAHFTVLAIEVERPDGSKIVDYLRSEDPPEDPPDQEVTDLKLLLSASPAVVAEGGGKRVTLTLVVTDGTGHPVAGADVSFHVGTHSGDRTNRLSPAQTTTNSSGIATTTYTTLATDDRLIIEINAAASANDLMEHMRTTIVAANDGAIVSGTVCDPATGQMVAGLPVNIFNPGTGQLSKPMLTVSTKSPSLAATIISGLNSQRSGEIVSLVPSHHTHSTTTREL